VICSDHEAIEPESAEESSVTYNDQTPFGSFPMKAPNVPLTPIGSGAGAGNLSPPP
jgi:hypothetical protein